MGWHCKATGGYTTGSPVYNYPDADGQDNCLQIYGILNQLGWTVNAICGLLTCAAFESGYNPWRWEANHILSEAGADADAYPGSYGYGLLQWTPASYNNAAYMAAHSGAHPNKYIANPNALNKAGYGPNFSDKPGSQFDGYAQMLYLDDYGYVGQYFRNSSYPSWADVAPTFAQYKASTAAASTLCETWVVNFERPANPNNNRAYRQALATELFNWLSGVIPPIPDTPGGKFPVWLLFKMREVNYGHRY